MEAETRPYTQADDDRIFVGRLRDNDYARRVVAEWFKRQGYEVTVPELRVRPSFEERHAYRDGGDMFVQKPDEPRHRVEVKTSTRPFQSAAQWPFPYMLVCKASDWDDANPKPWKYVIVDTTMRWGAVLRGDQIRPHHLRTQTDPKRHITYPAYGLPPGEFEYVKLR